MSVEESVLADLEKKLEKSLFVNGPQPSHADAEAFEKFISAKFVPDQDKNPSVWAWYSLMVLFEDEVVNSWKGSGKHEQQHQKGGKGGKHEQQNQQNQQNQKGGKKEKKGKKGKEEKEEKGGDDDDLDLFGEETEEDKKAKEEMKAKNKDKKKGKKKEVDKSHVILEVKGWEADQDLEELAKKIISTIKKDGLSWNTGYKMEEVAFGVKKLVIAFLAEDDKVSVQDIVDEINSWENDVQSVDIVSFNKA